MGRIRRFFRKSRAEKELDRELRFHLHNNLANGTYFPSHHSSLRTQHATYPNTVAHDRR
jgi:hypothetical protein